MSINLAESITSRLVFWLVFSQINAPYLVILFLDDFSYNPRLFVLLIYESQTHTIVPQRMTCPTFVRFSPIFDIKQNSIFHSLVIETLFRLVFHFIRLTLFFTSNSSRPVLSYEYGKVKFQRVKLSHGTRLLVWKVNVLHARVYTLLTRSRSNQK